MTWVLIGILGGSLVVSGHDSREACEGRAVVLREKGAAAKCTEAPGSGTYYAPGGTIRFCSGTTCYN